MWGSILAAPCFAASVLITNNFYLAMVFTFLKYLIGENFWSPNITMIQKSSPPEKFGNYVSAYQLFTILAGCISSFTFGLLINYFDCGLNPKMIGRLLAGFCTFGYGGAIISWWKAGKYFDKFKREEA